MASNRLPSTSGVRHTIVVLSALAYGIFLALVVFWPSPVDKPVQTQLARVIQELHERGVPAFVDYSFIEFTANIALFIPVGFILGMAVPVRWWILAIILGPAMSVGIEVIQDLLLDARYSSAKDVLANSAGATIGVFVAVIIRALVHARDTKVLARYQASVTSNSLMD